MAGFLLKHVPRDSKHRILDTSYTGEFVHPNVIYSMEIDAKVRRLVVGAALGNAG